MARRTGRPPGLEFIYGYELQIKIKVPRTPCPPAPHQRVVRGGLGGGLLSPRPVLRLTTSARAASGAVVYDNEI